VKYFAVVVDGIEYGMDPAIVAAVDFRPHPMPVPGAPPHLLGLQNVDGAAVPIIDLRLLLRRTPSSVRKASEGKNVLLRTDSASACIIVDSVRGIGAAGSPPRPLDVRLVLFGEQSKPSSVEEDRFQRIRQGLRRFASFTISDINDAWVEKRHGRWSMNRYISGGSAAVEGPGDAAEFLKGFASHGIGTLWDQGMREAFTSLLRGKRTGAFTVLNWGCGRGMDAYSIACILASARPGLRAKIWAFGDELGSIVAASSVKLERDEIPGWIMRSNAVVETGDTYGFSKKIRDMILFSLVEKPSPIECPPADIIVARDMLSYLGADQQRRVLEALRSALRPEGILLMGANEKPPKKDWKAISRGKLPAYRARGTRARE
jgi:chemotaxis methyl-accepting protein methylase